jgi:hypothetical protein
VPQDGEEEEEFDDTEGKDYVRSIDFGSDYKKGPHIQTQSS